MSRQGHGPGDCVEANERKGLWRTTIYAETQAEGESQERSMGVECLSQEAIKQAGNGTGRFIAREGARISVCPREYCMSGKGGRRRHRSKRMHGGKKNEYLTLWEGRSGVMCGARGKGRCVVLSRAVRVITIVAVSTISYVAAEIQHSYNPGYRHYTCIYKKG